MESIQVLPSFPSCKDESVVNLPEHYQEIICRLISRKNLPEKTFIKYFLRLFLKKNHKNL